MTEKPLSPRKPKPAPVPAGEPAPAVVAPAPPVRVRPVSASNHERVTAVVPTLLPNGKVDNAALVTHYRPFVRSVAGKIKKTLAKEIEFDDLMEFGMVGLLEAAERFDPKYGANFMTFSYYRVRGAIYDGLRQMGWVNRNEYAKLRFEERATAYLQNVSDRNAAPVGDGTDKTSEDEINELASQVQNLVTIYVTSLEGMEGLQVEDKEAIPVDTQLANVEMKKHVKAALLLLPEQEQRLLHMYYFKEMNLLQVGEQLGLSKSWTSRLHGKAVEKLGQILRDLTGEGRPAVGGLARGAKT